MGGNVSHKHMWDRDLNCTDIGGGICLTPFQSKNSAGYWVGFPREDGVKVMGTVHTRSPDLTRETWKQTGSLEGGDLTLTPSLLLDYGHGTQWHGWVREGKWVPA